MTPPPGPAAARPDAGPGWEPDERQARLALRANGLVPCRWRPLDDHLWCAGEPGRRLLGRTGGRDAPAPGLRRLVHPEDGARLDALEAEAEAGRAAEAQYRIVRPDGSVRWVAHSAWPERDGADGALCLVGTLADITLRQDAEAVLREAHEALEVRVIERTLALVRANDALRKEVAERRAAEEQVRELLGQIVMAEEEERRRVARELHDGIGQAVTALGLGLKALEGEATLPATLRERLRHLQRNARLLDDDVDRLSHRLRPAALDDLGLEEALRNLAGLWAEESQLQLEIHTQGLKGRPFPAPVATTVYRVVQEALHNVLKHARARRVGLIVEQRGDELRAIVEDDGCGFDAAIPQPSGLLRRRLGLRGMVERAALVGGRLEVETAPGRGTTIVLSVPVGSGGPPEADDTPTAAVPRPRA